MSQVVVETVQVERAIACEACERVNETYIIEMDVDEAIAMTLSEPSSFWERKSQTGPRYRWYTAEGRCRSC